LCSNDLGVDELLSFVANTVYDSGAGADFTVQLEYLAHGPRELASLRPVEDAGAATEAFLGLLAGSAPRTAVKTVCLNAAALALLAGRADGWPSAVLAAREAIESGAAVELCKRLRYEADLRTGRVSSHG
jgi:anthranilate phosphoribosyltransferase